MPPPPPPLRDPAGTVLVVGEALVDLVIGTDGTVAAALGGAPFNTARTCGRLGAPTRFAGALADDRFGTLLRERLIADGVEPLGPAVTAPTTLAAAELDATGAATYRFYLEGTSVPMLSAPPSVDDDVTIVHTGGLGLALEPMADAVAAMVAGVVPGPDAPTVVVDVNCRPHVIADRARYLARLWSVLAHADVVKVSDEDLAVLDPDRPGVDVARDVLAAGASVVLMTAGGASVEVLAADGDGRSVPVPAVDVVDTIGAGDAFGGGFCAWWALTGRRRADLADHDAVEDAVRAAITVAGVVCTRRGADPPSPADLPVRWPTS